MCPRCRSAECGGDCPLTRAEREAIARKGREVRAMREENDQEVCDARD